MILDSINKYVEVVLGEATITSECDIVVSYVDITESTFTAAGNDTVTTGTSAVIAIGAPGLGITRQVKEIIVNNRDTVPHTVIIRHVNLLSTTKRVKVQTVEVDDSLYYRPDALTGPAGVDGAPGATGAAAGAPGTPADFGCFFQGPLGASQEILYMVLTRAIDLPVNLTGSQFACRVLPTADFTCHLKQNGGSIGTVKFAAGTGVVTVTFSSGIGLSPGDSFEIVGNTSSDASIQDLSFNFVATFA